MFHRAAPRLNLFEQNTTGAALISLIPLKRRCLAAFSMPARIDTALHSINLWRRCRPRACQFFECGPLLRQQQQRRSTGFPGHDQRVQELKKTLDTYRQSVDELLERSASRGLLLCPKRRCRVRPTLGRTWGFRRLRRFDSRHCPESDVAIRPC